MTSVSFVHSKLPNAAGLRAGPAGTGVFNGSCEGPSSRDLCPPAGGSCEWRKCPRKAPDSGALGHSEIEGVDFLLGVMNAFLLHQDE